MRRSFGRRIALIIAAVFLSCCGAALSVAAQASSAQTQTAQTKTKKLHTVKKFKGVGKKGEIDLGLDNPSHKKYAYEDEESSGIQLPDGVQKVVDKADKTIRDIDESTLNAVKDPLKAIGLEAESAKLRPTGGGVGLGISINLDKKSDKNAAETEEDGTEKDTKKDGNEFYELIVPKDSSSASGY